LAEAADAGLRPASNRPEDIREFVRKAFEMSDGLHAQLKATKGIRSIYEVSITDQNGLVLTSTD